ncbi:MAG: hypothetical protein HFI88_14830 [Lachnospiraceae bacterium]|nr:hypothetical protein [Lachnospiraceae bacterium]
MEWIMKNLSPKTQEDICGYYMKNLLDVNKTAAKEQILNESRMELAYEKMQMQEYRREMRKARYLKLMIREDGELEIQVQNPMIKVPDRRCANFKFLDILRLESVEGDGPIYVLFLEIEKAEQHIYLTGEKVGKGEYLLKKITEVGGQIFVESHKKKVDFLLDFWTAICSFLSDQDKVLLSVSPGWITVDKNVYRFVEGGETLWKDMVRKAK